MKLLKTLIAPFVFAAALVSVSASPLTMEYTTTFSAGLYTYDFKLTVDNNDGSFVAGQGWRWLVFGDVPSGPSPIDDFVLIDPPAPGPWTGVGRTGGGHNGPDMQFVLDYWVPSLGDSILWSGTSATELLQGQLLFSTLAGTLNGGIAADFQVANHVASFSVPDAGSSLLFVAMGLTALVALRRRSAT